MDPVVHSQYILRQGHKEGGFAERSQASGGSTLEIEQQLVAVHTPLLQGGGGGGGGGVRVGF
jgi:hypothetical protein